MWAHRRPGGICRGAWRGRLAEIRDLETATSLDANRGASVNAAEVSGGARALNDAEHSIAWSAARDFLSQFESQTSEIIGSNNFVVSGEHTASGKPLLANDTHLEFSLPGIWYILHLTAPGWNVAGFTFPGSPLVVIGHNDRIAWGFTNSNAEVQDLYVETFNPANPLEYKVAGNWVRAETRREVIHVRGDADEMLDVVLTRHGPIVHRDAAEDGGRAYSLRWTAVEPGALDFSYPLIGSARNWNEFLQVMSRIAGPGQNGIYADVDGNIGYVMAARIPIRKSGNGALPVAGDSDDFEWTGYIPFGELPQVLNPRGGIIATANARTVGPAYKYFISDRWAGPYRTDRIYQLLGARKDLRPADANNVQNDIVSLPDKFLAQQLFAASQKAQPKDPRTKALLERLKNWDGRTSADSVETSFVENSRHALMEAILKPYIGEHLERYELWEPQSDYDDVWWRDKVFLANVLRDRPAAWLPKQYADYDALLIAAADTATERLASAAARWRSCACELGPVARAGDLSSLRPRRISAADFEYRPDRAGRFTRYRARDGLPARTGDALRCRSFELGSIADGNSRGRIGTVCQRSLSRSVSGVVRRARDSGCVQCRRRGPRSRASAETFACGIE